MLAVPGRSPQFRGEQRAVSGDVELILKTLERLLDGVGDASIAEALFGHDEGGRDAPR